MTADDDRHPDDWPHPNDRPCEDCGHVWFPGERRHEYVDHDAERPEDVEVLCVLCRQQRGFARAEE
jgi:hypothetical protein